MWDSNLKISLCRTCLVNITQTNAFHVFNTDDLAKKLMLCSGLDLEASDEYPENVCPQCYEKILIFYEFHQMCGKSLDTLNELLKKKNVLQEENSQCDARHENKTTKDFLSDKNLANSLEQNLSDPLENIEVTNKFFEKKKRGRPAKKNFEDLKLERNTVIKKSRRSNEEKAEFEANNCRNDKIEQNLQELLQFDDEKLHNEKNISNQEQFNDGFTKNLIETNLTPVLSLENKQKEKCPSDTESCSSIYENLTPQKHKHKCDRCDKIFNTRNRLETHRRQHDGLPPYCCTYEGCKRSFNRWHFYQKHQKDHDQEQLDSFKCDLENCQRVYKNKSALNIHKRKFHHLGPELKSHMCEICGKVFKSSAALNDHHYTHIDKTQLPYACEEGGCTKRFSNKEKLKTHKMRHAGIKNFICPYCGMRKTTRNELKIHINYHTLERTWPCRFCPKVCNSAGNLKMHVKNMHERAKEYACRFCEKTFAKADTKKYHEMTHTGEKPHACKECGRRFVQPAALRTHRKIHLRQKGGAGVKERRKGSNVREADGHKANTDEVNLLTEAIVAEILNETNCNMP